MKKTLIASFLVLVLSSLVLADAAAEAKWVKYGKYYFSKGQFDKAIKASNLALAENPSSVNALLIGGYSYIKAGDKDTGISYLSKAYELTGNPKIKAQIDRLGGGSVPAASKPFRFGPKLGLNIASVSGVTGGSLKSAMGICAGGFVIYSFSNIFAIQPELLYSQKGYATESTYNTTDYSTWPYKTITVKSTSTNTLSYIEIPVLLRVTLPIQGSPVLPSLLVGPSIGILAGVSAVSEEKRGDVTTKTSSSDSTYVSKMDFGLAIGAAALIAGSITFDFRYSLGLSNIFSYPNASSSVVVPVITNTVLSFIAGYAF